MTIMKTELEIYGTLGPSCRDEEVLRQMFAAGITGMRLNLSHGTLDESAPMIDAFHRASALEGVRPSLLIDMQGPELRIGIMKDKVEAAQGDTVLLSVRDDAPQDTDSIPVPIEIFDHFEPGMVVLIDDGKIRLRLEKETDTVRSRRISASVLTGGPVLSRKSIAVEGMSVTGNTLTQMGRNRCNAAFCARQKRSPRSEKGNGTVRCRKLPAFRQNREQRRNKRRRGDTPPCGYGRHCKRRSGKRCPALDTAQNTERNLRKMPSGGCPLYGSDADACEYGPLAGSDKGRGVRYFQCGQRRSFGSHDHRGISLRAVSRSRLGISR